ncbi:MAG: glutamate synthase large subunit [Candidatus Omnitrophota bacterium]|jgi:glutamate synthase domain-containing protein 2/glutamate synthase domain-containing protein 1/glutamate synthase domain-containing protein 3|nr:glutamate synthase large subunit [Candidatus Omnitrophota bacterium]MDD3983566.1 glutamate synthase large subunit [Candidatus Omnitrophota bacterium]
MNKRRRAEKYGLYDSRFEHDSCGVGFVCDIKGRPAHKIISQGLEILRRLSHRGATGADPLTGDGAGVLIQIPDGFFREVSGLELPSSGSYGCGMVFSPRSAQLRGMCRKIVGEEAVNCGLRLLGWRKVPVDRGSIGTTALKTMPEIEQVFIGGKGNFSQGLALERALYILRRKIENRVSAAIPKKDGELFYINSMSCRTIAYKGLLMPNQLETFFPDLTDERMSSGLCLVHSRYSTNTFPSWELSQPFRFLAHNGEINTLRGNINWMTARESLLKNDCLGADLKKILPIIVPGGSDSASLDNLFELLALSGRSLEHAMTMLIPPAWEGDATMGAAVKSFYKFHACLMEPWDGPAAAAFTDGSSIGAVLDRNGLRPARYIITKEGTAMMASETGVLDIAPGEIMRSGRIEPGKIFLVDTANGRIVADQEIKEKLAGGRPYSAWLKDNLRELEEFPAKRPAGSDLSGRALFPALKAFGYSREDMKVILEPMAVNAAEPVGSMGNDTPHAVLSGRPQLLFNYFKQLFAQVTNPAIDPIREELVMSLWSYLGPGGNLLEETPVQCRKILVKHPVLTMEEFARLRGIKTKGFKTRVISMLFSPVGRGGVRRELKRICREADKAIRDKYTFLLLSDRGMDAERAALPSLLAVGALHHHLVRKAGRSRISIIVESGEPREVHHFALLFGYGADCVAPYLAYEAVKHIARNQKESGVDEAQAVYNYRKAVEKGILKILSKMGISTLQSYRGAQIFEALGIGKEIIDLCFPGTVSRIGGISLDVITREVLRRHSGAFCGDKAAVLDTGGTYQWKKDGEFHLWNPESITALQEAVGRNDYSRYKEFAALINDQNGHPATLRGLLRFKAGNPVPIEEVEPAEEIVKRFATGAMSFGSISRGAHETLALAMNRLKGRSNTGEGGEDPIRFRPLPNGDSVRSSIKQVASGRFGVTTNYLVNADELQIKIAQGAKPGEGGQLPGHKVSPAIARTRYTTPGVTLISPSPHHDIYSIEDLAQLIFDLKNTNPQARISVKLVSEIGVGTIAAGVAKGHADMILISGGDGGTGASPWSSIKHAGLPWELGLSEAHQTLLLNDLRSRVRLQTDGQMRTGRDVAIAALLGAEEFGFSSAPLVVMGCVMLRHCNLNNCPLGIATQNDILQCRFKGKPEHLANYFRFVAEELREIMAGLGMRRVDEMVGRSDLLESDTALLSWKSRGLDFSRILYMPDGAGTDSGRCSIAQNHGLEGVLDSVLIAEAGPALKNKEQVVIEKRIHNTDRTTGAMLSGRVCLMHGEEGLPDGTIHCRFKGVAGQSFGAWLAGGVTLELEGLANDYVGKGISGGRIIIYPGKESGYNSSDNVIMGNTAFYGAISGEAYIRGMCGERFCVRNSGLHAVVEGVGDHGCEYMTGGRVVILGRTGRNFAAGMSGGIAYVYDREGNFPARCNMEMVELQHKLDEEDVAEIKMLLSNHYRYTGSQAAKETIDDFASRHRHFVKVLPFEYKKILLASRQSGPTQ